MRMTAVIAKFPEYSVEAMKSMADNVHLFYNEEKKELSYTTLEGENFRKRIEREKNEHRSSPI